MANIPIEELPNNELIKSIAGNLRIGAGSNTIDMTNSNLINANINSTTNNVTANSIRNASGIVTVSGAAPQSGYTLKATSATAAAWGPDLGIVGPATSLLNQVPVFDNLTGNHVAASKASIVDTNPTTTQLTTGDNALSLRGNNVLIEPVSAVTVNAPTVNSNAVLMLNGSKAMATETLIDGQVLIGRTGNTPVAGYISGTGNIVVSSTSGNISISAPNVSTLFWTRITTSDPVVLTHNNAVVIKTTLPVSFTMPTAEPPLGSHYKVIGITGGWSINAPEAYYFYCGNKFGNVAVTAGLPTDAINFYYVGNNIFYIDSVIGNIVIT